MFQHVIVKTPCKAMINGITDHPELGLPDYEKALTQHKAYVETLKKCGVDVTVLPPDEEYPDSCFVEDPAIVTKYCAIITNPGALSRKGETAAIETALKAFYPEDKIFHISAPGILEGGDVMMCGDTFYVGESARTNAEGIHQLAEILEPFGCKIEAVPLSEVLHLKTPVFPIWKRTICSRPENSAQSPTLHRIISCKFRRMRPMAQTVSGSTERSLCRRVIRL